MSSPSIAIVLRTVGVLLPLLVLLGMAVPAVSAADPDTNTPSGSAAAPAAVPVEDEAESASVVRARNFRARLRPVSAESAARGNATFMINRAENRITFRLRVQNIEGVTAAHIHLDRPAQGNPILVTLFESLRARGTGEVNGLLASGVITSEDVEGQFAERANPMRALIRAMRGERLFVNVHTRDFPGGELRGDIMRVVVVEEEDVDRDFIERDFDEDDFEDRDVVRPDDDDEDDDD